MCLNGTGGRGSLDLCRVLRRLAIVTSQGRGNEKSARGNERVLHCDSNDDAIKKKRAAAVVQRLEFLNEPFRCWKLLK